MQVREGYISSSPHFDAVLRVLAGNPGPVLLNSAQGRVCVRSARSDALAISSRAYLATFSGK